MKRLKAIIITVKLDRWDKNSKVVLYLIQHTHISKSSNWLPLYPFLRFVDLLMFFEFTIVLIILISMRLYLQVRVHKNAYIILNLQKFRLRP